jgi:hypothetical protein
MKLPAIILLAGTGVFIITNIILIATGNSSFSQTIQGAAGQYPVIPFGLGVLMGHWLWPVRKK